MEIEAKKNTDQGALETKCEFDMPDTLEGMAKKFGEDKVYGYAKRAIVVSIQNAMRAELDSSGNADEAAKVGESWMPPEPRAKDPVAKALKNFDDLSPEQLKAVQNLLKQRMKDAAA